MNEIVISNHILPTIESCDQCIATEPFLHADRVLDFNVMIYVTDGVIYVTEAGTEYAIHPGELLFLKKGVHHYGTKLIPKGTRWFYVHFYLNEPDECLSQFSKSRTTNHASRYLPKFVKDLPSYQFDQLIQKFVDFYHSSDSMQNWYHPIRFFELLSELTTYQTTESRSEVLVNSICEFLSDQIKVPFSSQELEQHFFLSYKYMASIFKKEKNMTMQQYHTRLRMNSAAKLLGSTLLPINEIADYFGYSDQLYFSRCFHEFSGMSPSAFRKSQITRY